MKQAFLITLVLFLSGCTADFSANSAVKNLTIGEYIVSKNLDRNATNEDIKRKLDHLKTKVPFDIDKSFGEGFSKCQNISNIRFDTKKMADDATSITNNFTVDEKYEVEFQFIGKSHDFKLFNLYARPMYLIGVSASNNGKVFFDSDGYSDASASLITGIVINCNISEKLNNLFALHQQSLTTPKEKELIKEWEAIKNNPDEHLNKCTTGFAEIAVQLGGMSASEATIHAQTSCKVTLEYYYQCMAKPNPKITECFPENDAD